MASFPASLWSGNSRGANLSNADTHTKWHDDIAAEVIALETALATAPAGSDASVKARLDRIDANATAWTSYTPSAGAGWSIGTTGSDAQGAYCVVNKVVFFWARLVFGTSGAVFGASVASVSLPAPVEAGHLAYVTRSNIVAEFYDTSAALPYNGLGELVSGSIANLLCFNAAGTYSTMSYVVNTVPFTWAVSDVIRLSGWYRRT